MYTLDKILKFENKVMTQEAEKNKKENDRVEGKWVNKDEAQFIEI